MRRSGRDVGLRERDTLALAGPGEVADWAQSAKTALAGVLAWVVATDVLGLEQPFLAPWAAVLVVHATVYRTVSRGGQQMAATFLGVLLAWASGTLFGVGPLGMGVMLAVSFLIGRHRWLERGVDDDRDHRDRRTRHERDRRLQPAHRPPARHDGRRRRRARGQLRGVAAAA